MKGLVHVYTGDGKGKTSAAIGLCTRISGWGKKAAFYEFLKGSHTGEAKALPKLGVDFYCGISQEKFVFAMTEQEKQECALRQIDTLNKAKENAEKYDLIVLDEVLSAVETGMLSKEDVINFIKEKPMATEIVLTGRHAFAGLLGYADYASEINAIKHPYNEGIPARKGIEY